MEEELKELIAAHDLSGVELFLQANPEAANMKMEYGMVPLEYAIKHSTLDMAILLHNYGALFGSNETAAYVARDLLERIDPGTMVYRWFGHVEEDQIDNVIGQLDEMEEEEGGVIDEVTSLIVFVAMSDELTEKQRKIILNKIKKYRPKFNISEIEDYITMQTSWKRRKALVMAKHIANNLSGGRRTRRRNGRKHGKKLKTRRAQHRKAGH